jgi:hypothetical protein
MTDHDLRRRLFDLLLGHEDAVAFNLALMDVLHLWDDLIDGDKPVTPEDVHKAFRLALVVIPGNPFYRRHFDQLHPLIDPLILNWLTANDMEARGEQLDIAWVIRSDYCNVLLKSLEIVGGFDHARRVWPDVRAYWHSEGFNQYLTSLAEEQAIKKNRGA